MPKYFILINIVSLILVSCTTSMMVRTVNWEVHKTTSKKAKNYLDQNYEKLDPIEGIWTVNSPRETNYAKVLILRDTTSNERDFFEVVLSSNDGWLANTVTAHFTSLAYKGTYVSKQFSPDGSSNMYNFHLNKSGVLESSNSDIYYLKVYPQEKTYPIEQELRASKSYSGTGFLVTKSGLVVTNYHVVENANDILVSIPETDLVLNASVQIKDSQNDLCILKLSDFEYTKFYKEEIPYNIGATDQLRIGHDVYTLGYPLGRIMGTKSRLSTGQINSLFGYLDDPRLLQISNPIQPGNSGGPLLNHKAEIIGIVVSGLNAKYFYDNLGIIPQNVNFAIKSNYLTNLLNLVPDYEMSNKNNELKHKELEEQIEIIKRYVVQISANK
jgi:S1-C subfamily serine protease